MAGPIELKPGLHRLGSDKVNFFLIEEASRVTLVDDLVLPGHGDPWTGGTATAVARAREAGPS